MKKKIESMIGWLSFWIIYIIYYPVILFDKYFNKKSQEEDEKTMKELLQYKQEVEEEVLSDFIDLMIKHGTGSREVKNFMRKYRDDREFWRKLKAAKDIRIMYKEGELD